MINGIQKIMAVSPKKKNNLTGVAYQNDDGTVEIHIEETYKDINAACEDWNITDSEDLIPD